MITLYLFSNLKELEMIVDAPKVDSKSVRNYLCAIKCYLNKQYGVSFTINHQENYTIYSLIPAFELFMYYIIHIILIPAFVQKLNFIIIINNNIVLIPGSS